MIMNSSVRIVTTIPLVIRVHEEASATKRCTKFYQEHLVGPIVHHARVVRTFPRRTAGDNFADTCTVIGLLLSCKADAVSDFAALSRVAEEPPSNSPAVTFLRHNGILLLEKTIWRMEDCNWYVPVDLFSPHEMDDLIY
jgi:hypothetical protein